MHIFSGSFEIPEAGLLKDLMYCFQGIEGKWIKFDSSREGYRIDPQVCTHAKQLNFFSICIAVITPTLNCAPIMKYRMSFNFVFIICL